MSFVLRNCLGCKSELWIRWDEVEYLCSVIVWFGLVWSISDCGFWSGCYMEAIDVSGSIIWSEDLFELSGRLEACLYSVKSYPVHAGFKKSLRPLI